MAPGALPVGVTLSTLGVDAAWWIDSARRLDEAGYRAVWAWDHFVSKGDRTTPVLEAWTLLSAAASVTRRVSLGPYVLNVMNRHPAVLARMATTLQEVAGGRLRLGMGIGGHPREHEAYGIHFPDPPERVARLREAVHILRALWAGGPVDAAGAYHSLRDAYARPVASSPPPIVIGAQTRGGVRLAAEIGDGWAAEAPHFDRLLPGYLEALAAHGKARAAHTIVLGFSEGRSGQSSIAGTAFAADPGATVEEWLARGADEVALTARTPADVAALLAAAERL